MRTPGWIDTAACSSVVVALVLLQWPMAHAERPAEGGIPPDGSPWISVSTFGARGDGRTDDTHAIRNAIGAASGSGQTLFFPKGTYMISSTIQATAHGLRIEGAGPNHTSIVAAARMDRMLYLRGSNIVITRMAFNGAGKAKYAIHAFHLNSPGARLGFLTAYGARSHGSFLDHSQLLEVTHCVSEDNGGDGFYVTDCNAAVIRFCRSRGNKGRGFTITSTDYSGGCYVLDCNVETNPSNRGDGMEYVLVTAAHGTPVVIKRLWAEGRRNNLYDAVRIASPSVMLTESRISLGGDNSVRARHSVHLAKDTLVNVDEVRGDFDPGETVRGEKSGTTAVVSFWQAAPAWSDSFPIPAPYKAQLDRPRKLVLMEVSGEFENGEVVAGVKSGARGSVQSTAIVSARNCVIEHNWLAREEAISPPARIYIDAGLTNRVGDNYSMWTASLIPVVEETYEKMLQHQEGKAD